MEWQLCLLVYFAAVNVVSFLLMYIDKRRAVKHEWRIPEKTLFLWAFLGGSPGSLLGMYTFRHKTKHLSFVLGMPAILLAELAVAVAAAYFVG